MHRPCISRAWKWRRASTRTLPPRWDYWFLSATRFELLLISHQLDYTTKCRKATDALEDVVTAEYPPIPEIDRSGLRTEHGQLAQQIGPYEHAVYHRDGRTATVYRSRNKSGQLVALKATSPHLMFAPHNSEREARILREAAHHNVAELLETFYEIGGHFILVFPFLSFQLDQLLRHDALSMKQTRRCLADLFRALSHIHSLGIIHRDVKPSNVLLRSASGPAVLADFGIAWSPRDKDSESPDEKITDVGTEAYRPPELLFGYQSYGPELDIWAAGCVAAEAVRPGHDHLFDSGPLGSDLALVQSIFSTLGTPNTDTWPVCLIHPPTRSHVICLC